MSAAISGLLFAISLYLIFSEKLHRTITAMISAAAMLILGQVLHFYGEEEALAAVDFETIGLLLGMMTLVALLEPTGFFSIWRCGRRGCRAAGRYACWSC